VTGPVATPATPTALGASAAPSTEAQREQLRQAAQAFEAIFLRQMIGSMRNARLAEDVFGSASSEQFRDMGDAQLADSMSRQGSFGIAELLLAQFNRAVPAAPAGATTEASSDIPNRNAS
jgi:flagellar protein FlgJ